MVFEQGERSRAFDDQMWFDALRPNMPFLLPFVELRLSTRSSAAGAWSFGVLWWCPLSSCLQWDTAVRGEWAALAVWSSDCLRSQCQVCSFKGQQLLRRRTGRAFLELRGFRLPTSVWEGLSISLFTRHTEVQSSSEFTGVPGGINLIHKHSLHS